MTRLPLIAGFICGMLVAWVPSCGGGGGGIAQAPIPAEASPWQIGVNSDKTATRLQDGWAFDIPQQGSVNYITRPTGSLAGKTKITLRVRIEMADGTRLAPPKFPNAPSLLTLYFQREGDDWSAVGPYEAYRWFASFATRSDLKAGEYVIEAPLDGNWTAVMGSTRASNPQGFQDAIDNAGRIGFVLGGGDGLGHGLFATGPARFVVTDFNVQ